MWPFFSLGVRRSFKAVCVGLHAASAWLLLCTMVYRLRLAQGLFYKNKKYGHICICYAPWAYMLYIAMHAGLKGIGVRRCRNYVHNTKRSINSRGFVEAIAYLLAIWHALSLCVHCFWLLTLTATRGSFRHYVYCMLTCALQVCYRVLRRSQRERHR